MGMQGRDEVGMVAAHRAVLAGIVSDVQAARAAQNAAFVAETRALARAGELARMQTLGSPQRVRDHDMALRSIAAELAGVMRLSDRSVQRRIGDAVELAGDYPATLDACARGVITPGHVRVIVETGVILPPEVRGGFEEAALERCARETPGRVRAGLAILAERMHPRSLGARHREARETRGVRVSALPDGMSDLIVTGPTLVIDAIYDRLTQQARCITDVRADAAKARRAAPATTRPGGMGNGTSPTDDATVRTDEDDAEAIIASDSRTTDQLRADLLCDMLLTAAPGADPTRTDDGPGLLGAIRGKVQVVVPALTLLDTDDGPADLVGRSPIDPGTARELAGVIPSPWERILTHPVTGTVLHVDTYQRPAAMDRYLRGRDRRCRFPGCGMPAIRSEVDHTQDHALGGRTEIGNLAHLCQRHHSMKQFTPWAVTQKPGGVLEWTSPLGKTYIDDPPIPTVHFVPTADGDPPPF